MQGDKEKQMDQDIELTVDEIQRIMDRMDKRTFGSETGLEWEGSIQNAPEGSK